MPSSVRDSTRWRLEDRSSSTTSTPTTTGGTGRAAPEAPEEDNPEVNVGTGSLDGDRWGGVVDAFIGAFAGRATAGGEIDVRENVRFEGAHLAKWVHERYPDHGVALALEFKKTYMDEWTGEPDQQRIDTLARALGQTVEPVLRALRAAAGARR